jgi:hypothetical protein
MTEQEIDEQIQDFVEHRASIKRPMSEVAIKRLKQRAMRMNARGIDLLEAFDKAITSGWQSIYEPQEAKKESKPASFRPYTGPNYGERSTPEAARNAVQAALRVVRGSK